MNASKKLVLANIYFLFGGEHNCDCKGECCRVQQAGRCKIIINIFQYRIICDIFCEIVRE